MRNYLFQKHIKVLLKLINFNRFIPQANSQDFDVGLLEIN